MAYLAVDKDGTEFFYRFQPIRNEDKGIWDCYMNRQTDCVEVPDGTIEKVIDKIISWEDDPVEI